MEEKNYQGGFGSKRRAGLSSWTPAYLALGAVLAFAMTGALAWLHASWVLATTPAIEAGPGHVQIPPSEGPVGVADRLHRGGVIQSRSGFVALALWRGTAHALKPGAYTIPEGANTVRILRLLEEGETQPKTITIQGGWTVRRIARTLEEEGVARAAEVMRLSGDRNFLHRLGVEGASLEGYLLPGTHHVFTSDSIEEVLARMVRRLRREIAEPLAGQMHARGLTLHQALTLASVVEKETAVDSEMPTIAAVFWNRLKRQMLLEAEPTVRYALSKHGRPLTRGDLRVDSPFNTYRYQGLPPGPIANPGKAAILAALHPAKVKYLYFVSKNGRHHAFSVTQKQHQAAVARYRPAKPSREPGHRDGRSTALEARWPGANLADGSGDTAGTQGHIPKPPTGPSDPGGLPPASVLAAAQPRHLH